MTPLLAPHHYAMLHNESAITDEVITARGYRSLAHPDDLQDLGFSKVQARTAPALAIPLWDVHGRQTGWQIRPDSPRQMKGGKVVKYETPRGGRISLDIHPSMQPLLGDPAVPLWITEGVKKGDALVSHGQCTIALMGGVWGFRGSNEYGGKVILPAWQHVALNARVVYVVYDSDIYLKSEIEAALKALYRFLRERQARPSRVRWPEEYRHCKIGVDDFFAQGHTLEELLAMVPPMGPLPTVPHTHQRRNGQMPDKGISTSDLRNTRPAIRIGPDITRMVEEGQTALMALPDGPLLFQRARRLAIIAHGMPPPKWLRRAADAATIVEVQVPYLDELATRAARWEKFDVRQDEWREVTPPTRFAATLFARPTWPFPLLEGIIHTPTLRPDGSILATPGYDSDTGLYLDLNGTAFPPLRPHPTLDDARSALGTLQEVFHDFPFAKPWHWSATIAALLTLVARDAIQGSVPLLGITATAAGSGKGKLADTIALIGTGRPAPKMAQTLDPEEEAKRLLALALEGASICCIDNITAPLGSPALDMALTAQSYKGRILGQTANSEAPWRALLFATGNNLQYRGDLARRVVPIVIDPKMEKPEERSNFLHPELEKWVLEQRPRLVVAALTILRAYFEAGCLDQELTPYGSFEAWSNLIRHALVWAGEADPCEGRKDLAAETDQRYEDLATLLDAWDGCYKDTKKTLNFAKQEISLYAANKDQVPNTWDALRDALGAFDKRYDGKRLDTHAIGNALRYVEGKVIGSKRLIKAGEVKRASEWKLERV